MSDAIPALSVVIPTIGRPDLVQTLQSLAAAREFQRAEVIIVGRLANADVAAQVENYCHLYPQARHLPLAFAQGDSSAKKNAGWQAARAEVVAFIDDDVIIPQDWLANILEIFQSSDTILLTGPALPPKNVNLTGRLAALALSSAASGYVSRRYTRQAAAPVIARWSDIIGCNMVWRKKALEEIGGFDQKFWPGEEMLASYCATQKGYHLVCAPAIWLWHMPRRTLRGFWQQIRGYGATRIRLIRAGVEIEFTTLVPALLAGSLAGLLLLSFFFTPARWLLGLELAAYAFLPLGATIRAMIRHRRAADILLLGMIPLMHLSYGLGELQELIRPGLDFGRTIQPEHPAK